MIEYKDKIFFLSTENTSYIFGITKFGHPENIYYGNKIPFGNIDSLRTKRSIAMGSSVLYSSTDDTYCLDTIPLEYSGTGKGDYRHYPVEIRMPDSSFVSDFIYKKHNIYEGISKMTTLPFSTGQNDECDTLEIIFEDEVNQVELKMNYTVFNGTNVITRNIVLKNNNEKSLSIRKLMSFMLDLNIPNASMLKLSGGWIKEAHIDKMPLSRGLYVNESITGASSNRHNPGIIIHQDSTSEDYGAAYGFNLIYSGNHYEAVDVDGNGFIRVMAGINPYCFEWILEKDEEFETPQAVLTFSSSGFNGLSKNFHDFINNHIVRGEYKNSVRPVLLNGWEAFFFKYNQRKLLNLAQQGKKLGIELFVLDDGWFGDRNNDKAGLGDYNVNKKKFPAGLSAFSKKLKKEGLDFGLWVEPEMINEDSNLFREHPEYTVRVPGRNPALGRNQMVLDLCNRNVRDYIVENVGIILDEANVKYVKWDMNRHISDMYSSSIPCQGMFFHKYIIGLYDVLSRIFTQRPHILLESCSSGGNRFDLGMLVFSPQIWASDDTDPIERLKIQKGLSYFYPLSCIGAHVSSSPHQQTLRATPLSTRFNVAAFGNLGYELDLKYLSFIQKKEIKKQISFYKSNRNILQYGTFYRFNKTGEFQENFMCVSRDRQTAVAGNFQILARAGEGNDLLPLRGLEDDCTYTVKTLEKGLSVKNFGSLINHILPFKIKPDGFIIRTVDKFFQMTDCVEEFTATGKVLNEGIRLNTQFIGTGYNKNVRMTGDFGSNLYFIHQTGN